MTDHEQNHQLDGSVFLGLAVKLNLLTAAQIDAAVAAMTENSELSIAGWCQKQGFITKANCDLIASIAFNLHNTQSKTEASFSELSLESQHLLSNSWKRLNAGVLKSLESLREPIDATRSFRGKHSDKGRFQILRPLAKGGLGELFVAKDTELNREVALKTIKKWSEHDPASQGRFMLEAEVTAKLEHPGIVPVYGFGYDENNCPFYAMRYLVGRTLKDQLQKFHESDEPVLAGDRAVEFRKYLRSFIDVCQAVSYGHSRGILHRDLKPSNIVVGRFDQTFVVDWGLAKAAGHSHTDAGARYAEPAIVPSSGSSASATVAGQAVGTPAFMSPEQAAGQNEKLDRRTDVYSLGATLYFVLTGETPFAAGSDILQRIQFGDFKSPLKLKPAMPAALAAICLKAMALRVQDRYQTTEEFANDLERWLADEPVSVFPDRQVDRWRRAYRRNPRFYHLAGVTLLIAAIGSAGAAFLFGKKNVQLAEFSQQIVAERDAAVMNYEKARELAFELLMVEERELTSVPGKVSIRVHLASQVNAAMKYFHDQTPGNADVQNSYAQTSRVLANLYRNTGHYDEAAAKFAVAKRLFQSVSASDKSRRDAAQIRLALTLIDEAAGNTAQGRVRTARKLLSSAKGITSLRMVADPENVSVALTAARADMSLSSCYWELCQEEECLQAAQSAEQGFRLAVAKAPVSFQNIALLIGSLHGQIGALEAKGQLEEARSIAQEAFELATAHQSANPTNDQRHFLLKSNRLLQEIRLKLEPEAEDVGDKLLDIRQQYEQLVADFAGFPRYKRHLAECCLVEAQWHVMRDDRTTALARLHKSIQLVEPYAARLSSAPYWEIMAEAHAVKAKLMEPEDPAAAAAAATSALEWQQRLKSENPESQQQAKRLIELLEELKRLTKAPPPTG